MISNVLYYLFEGQSKHISVRALEEKRKISARPFRFFCSGLMLQHTAHHCGTSRRCGSIRCFRTAKIPQAEWSKRCIATRSSWLECVRFAVDVLVRLELLPGGETPQAPRRTRGRLSCLRGVDGLAFLALPFAGLLPVLAYLVVHQELS